MTSFWILQEIFDKIDGMRLRVMKIVLFLQRWTFNNWNMSRPIKETPILYGKDARRFLARMKEKRTETPEQRAKRIADYEMIKKLFEN